MTTLILLLSMLAIVCNGISLLLDDWIAEQKMKKRKEYIALGDWPVDNESTLDEVNRRRGHE